MRVVTVTTDTEQVYANLCQGYEAEFSSITGKIPGAQGLFALDTPLGGPVSGLLLMVEDLPAGLAAVKTRADGSRDLCEFYVVPARRRQSWGRVFARQVFFLFPGSWEVKQITGAEHATAFWRKVIGEVTGGCFAEDRFVDPYWGPVTRQRFVLP